jgi:hypothetical protein
VTSVQNTFRSCEICSKYVPSNFRAVILNVAGGGGLVVLVWYAIFSWPSLKWHNHDTKNTPCHKLDQHPTGPALLL